MNNHTQPPQQHDHPPARPRPRQASPPVLVPRPPWAHRSASSMSAAANDSTTKQQAPVQQSTARPSTAHATTAPPSALANFSRPQPRQSIDAQLRMTSPPPPPPTAPPSIHSRGRQHSQGFFEPSLPHTSHMPASQIAAQAAMHYMHNLNPNPPPDRKRPNPPLQPINVAATRLDRRIASPTTLSPPPLQSANIDSRITATTAANVVFPRSPAPMPSPHALTADQPVSAPPIPVPAETKVKERSKMKLFHKPKSIGITKDKDFDKKAAPALPSPNRGLLRAGFASASMTSLTDPNSSAAASVYSSANTSTSTLVPVTTMATATFDKREDKEKPRHHFLSRQKQKDRGALPLSSASSNSTAVDPNAPQSLYSFTPQSPGFSKSVSGLDLRHGGRALREKKKEEKAAAAAATLTPTMSNTSGNLLRDDSRSDFGGPSSLDSASILGPPSSNSLFSLPLYEAQPTMSAAAFNNLGNSMGLHGITADDAWPLLKARLLNIFSGEDLRTPIEDFNLLVSVHIRRCIQKRAPVLLVEDLRELLTTGFSSLAQTLQRVPDERLVTRLVAIWQTTFSSILPFIQAVFLPLDLEFRGHGSIMSAREAQEFWGAFVPAEMPPPPFTRKQSSSFDEMRPSSSGGATLTSNTSNRMPGLGEELDVRRIALIVFRDVVLLPRHETLLAIFSRLSLDSINTTPVPSNLSSSPPMSSNRGRGFSNPAAGGAERPSTGGSLSPRLGSSFNSNANYLDSGNTTIVSSPPTQHSRSRATSNTSAGSFGTSLPHSTSHYPTTSIDSVTSAPAFSSSFSPDPSGKPPTFADPAQVTQIVARMLQCVSVVAGAQTGDQSQAVVERLTRELKYNWLGRGRTGRQRRGWVGVKGKNTGSMGQGQVNGLGVVGA